MTVTFIHRSSFLIELSSCYLLFDFYQGKLPELDPDKPLYIFASHSHYDHFDRCVFRLGEAGQKVQWILSDDILKKFVPVQARPSTVFLKPHRTFADERIRVETLRSTDLGVAFWVTVTEEDGDTTVYHAGDLNDWYWDGDEDDLALEQRYLRELERIRGRHADVAFVPVDPRLQQHGYLGLYYFLHYVTADVVFPMHFWKKYD